MHNKQVRDHAAVQHVAAVTTCGLEHTYDSAVCGRIDNPKQKYLTACFAPNGTSDQRQAAVGEGVAAVAKRAREQKAEALADTLKRYIREDDEELKFARGMYKKVSYDELLVRASTNAVQARPDDEFWTEYLSKLLERRDAAEPRNAEGREELGHLLSSRRQRQQ